PNLPVSTTAESFLQLHGWRHILPPLPAAEPPPTTHSPHQRELLGRRGVQLVPAAAPPRAISGAIDTATDATAAAAVSAGDALQPQLSAAVAAPPDAAPLGALWDGRVLRLLYAATHAEHGQCRDFDLRDGVRLAPESTVPRPHPQSRAGVHPPVGATGAQDAAPAQPVGCGQT
ncbi:hypothetical protein KR067_005065, partial [Drosophila pandora]